MIFNYSTYTAIDGKTVHFPLVPVVFANGIFSTASWALVDSGSDITVLPIKFAEKLGIRINVGLKKLFESAGGNAFVTYQSAVKVRHHVTQSGFKDIEWQSYVYFVESQETILLGREGFMNNFVVTFDGRRQQIKIT